MDQKDSMEEGADGTERPGEFLANLGQALREQDGADVGLAEILSTHLLTAEPAADAVSKANAAILKLARTRAALRDRRRTVAEACFLQSLGIAGFRAFLGPKTFDFSKKRCLAIFAPNGYGKSSVVDALEFMLSKEGTLIRLGQRAVHNQAGPVALVHNLAAETNITPSVEICAVSGKDRECGSRTATGADREMPAVGKTLNAHFKVSPIVRGHELRRFVEARTPEQRYADIANWLQLGPLVEVQKNIRLLRMQVKAAAEDERDLQRVDTQLARETAQLVRAWETTPILTHINESILAPLDPALTLTALATADGAYVALEARAEEEADKIGLAGLRQIRNATAALKAETTDAEIGKVVISGAIPTFDKALAALSSATTREEEERKKSANAAFQSLWKAAEPFFAESTPAPDVCPVCATPIAATATGSSEGIRIHIAQHLEELANYAAAKRAGDVPISVEIRGAGVAG